MRWCAVALALTVGGCDDFLFGELIDVQTAPEARGYDGVREVVAAHCFGCHGSGVALGGLDLETDLYAATVDVVGQYQIPIVRPGDPANSMLYLKITDTYPPNTGTDMPPGSGGLPLGLTDIVLEWIVGGAPDASGAVTPADTGS